MTLLVLRFAHSHSFGYLHLLWNLFLAWLPALSSLAAYNLYRKRSFLSWMIISACVLIWLIFFPNAPYLLTDLMHLQQPRVNRQTPGPLQWRYSLFVYGSQSS